MRKPWRLRWADRIDADVSHVACGNGFSLIAIRDSKDIKGHHLFGTGINTHSQIGKLIKHHSKFKMDSSLEITDLSDARKPRLHLVLL
jgi:hypothetical protein